MPERAKGSGSDSFCCAYPAGAFQNPSSANLHRGADSKVSQLHQTSSPNIFTGNIMLAEQLQEDIANEVLLWVVWVSLRTAKDIVFCCHSAVSARSQCFVYWNGDHISAKAHHVYMLLTSSLSCQCAFNISLRRSMGWEQSLLS